jgi:hypothetical protein
MNIKTALIASFLKYLNFIKDKASAKSIYTKTNCLTPTVPCPFASSINALRMLPYAKLKAKNSPSIIVRNRQMYFISKAFEVSIQEINNGYK